LTKALECFKKSGRKLFSRERAELCVSCAAKGKTMLKRAEEFIYRARWALLAAVLAVLVAANLNGSSIDFWNDITGASQEHHGVLFGKARAVRSDEFMVFTPYSLSQANSGYHYFSPIARGTDTDVYIEYGQAVADYAAIFRPFTIGYFFLGAERGYSFWWCGRLLALFAVSFAFAERLLFGRKRGGRLPALFWALLVAFSPWVQWWFAVNGLVEMLIASQLSLICFDAYFQHGDSFGKRLACSFGVFYAAGMFLMAVYPKWMIPTAYLIAAGIACVAVKHFRKYRFSKADIALIGIPMLWLIVSIGYILLKSHGAIEAISNTVYPGHYINAEAYEDASPLFWQFINFFQTSGQGVPFRNESELAVVFNFFPVNLLLLGAGLFGKWKKEKKLDLPAVLTGAVFIFFTCYFFFGASELVATVTFLGQSGRLMCVQTLAGLVLFVRGIYLVKKYRVNALSPWLLAAAAALSVGTALCCKYYWPDYFSKKRMLIVACVLFGGYAAAALYARAKRENALRYVLAAAGAIVAFQAGFKANPVQQGLSAVTENFVYKKVQEMNGAEPGTWVVDCELEVNNLPLAAGASTINCTNIYPNLELWRRIDEDGANEYIYNRYAHITVKVADTDEPVFTLNSPDYFQVELGGEDLKKIGADYILTKRDISDTGIEDAGYVLAGEAEQYKIYHLEQ